MPHPTEILAALAVELERPRPLPAQVTRHLSGVHDVERDGIGAFLTNELSKLEDYEIDLAFAPVFTPTLPEQATFADLFGSTSIPSSEWPPLIRALVDRPTSARLVTEDGQSHIVPLREVSIERFVNRLRLNGTIPPALLALIETRVSAAEQPILKAIARRAIWESDPRRAILHHFVERTSSDSTERLADAVQLLKVMETYEPADTADLLTRIPHWETVLRHEISGASSPKPFFNERVQDLHGGGRDQRSRSDMEPKQSELLFLARLKQILGG